MSAELQEGQCGACGQINGHDQECPATKVVITDKRELKRLEAEARRLQQEAETVDQAETQVSGDVEVDPDLAEGMARVDRIAQLRLMASEEELGEAEAAELLRLQGEQMEAEKEAEEAASGTSALTAFLVIIGHDGTATATTDMDQLVTVDRESTIDDMYAGCSIVVRDIQASLAAKHVVFGIQVAGQAMQEKAQASQMAQKLAGMGINPMQVRRKR